MLHYETSFWRDKVFTLICTGFALFAVLTVVALFLYPGGTISDPNTKGYSFFANWFSELGRFHTRSGAPNFASAALFFAAMTLAGLSLIMFSLAFPQFFRQPGAQRTLNMIGTVFGIISGICFVGVGSTPGDVVLPAHAQFAAWAFRSFIFAAFFWASAIFRNDDYPKRSAWIFVGFGILVTAWLVMLPLLPARTAQGNLIRSASQKVIAYASLFTIFIQSYGARAVNRM